MLCEETIVQYFSNHANSHLHNCVRKMQNERCTELPIASSPRPLNLVKWWLTFSYPQYGSYYMSPFWHVEFWGGLRDFLEQFLHLWQKLGTVVACSNYCAVPMWDCLFSSLYCTRRLRKSYEKRLLAWSCLSARPSIRARRTTRLPMDGFSWNFIFEKFFFENLSRHLKIH